MGFTTRFTTVRAEVMPSTMQSSGAQSATICRRLGAFLAGIDGVPPSRSITDLSRADWESPRSPVSVDKHNAKKVDVRDEKPTRDAGEDTRRMKAALVMAAALAFAAAPLVVPFQGFDPDLFPVPQTDPPIQPAGYAFAIWGPIYLWLLISAGFGLVARAGSPAWDASRWPIFVSLAVGALWLAVAQVSPLWATLLIWVMLLAALLALFRTPRADRWLLRAPLALYAGWLTAASWVALGLLGAGYGIGPTEIGWALVGLTGAFVTALWVQRSQSWGPTYTVAVVWALLGVAVANAGEAWALAALALIGAFALTALAVFAART
jgi:hypothetical protein